MASKPSKVFLSTLLSRKVPHYYGDLNQFPSLPSDRRKDSHLPVAWRAMEEHLKIFFEKVPQAIEEALDEKQLPLGLKLKGNKKGKIFYIPWEICAVHNADTSDCLDGQPSLSMSLFYDSDSDALVIYFINPENLLKPSFPSYTDNGIFILDVNATGKIISIEILNAKDYLDLLF